MINIECSCWIGKSSNFVAQWPGFVNPGRAGVCSLCCWLLQKFV